ncbi:hypothetical protein [Bacillus sp. AFS037270]|uniref:hypothetical protein n=1 Tax=Bacillus sp. AFS037270 TaxID=2033499 RepID=UPI000BFC486D|nr:hypothetical protein [Bacillus sp. AFS037270]PGV52474.1 hypothetical protein COD92_09750 [Bacillus sp. AFS037270]
MNKTAKFAMMLCFAGTLSLSLGFLSQNNLTKAETVSQQNVQINKDQKLVISAEEQTIVESMEKAIPSHDNSLKYFQRQDGTGFYFQKAVN